MKKVMIMFPLLMAGIVLCAQPVDTVAMRMSAVGP